MPSRSADYELRRELIRIGAQRSIDHLDELERELRYVPITTVIWRHAARLWALQRQRGQPAAAPASLDCDVFDRCVQRTPGLPGHAGARRGARGWRAHEDLAVRGHERVRADPGGGGADAAAGDDLAVDRWCAGRGREDRAASARLVARHAMGPTGPTRSIPPCLRDRGSRRARRWRGPPLPLKLPP